MEANGILPLNKIENQKYCCIPGKTVEMHASKTPCMIQSSEMYLNYTFIYLNYTLTPQKILNNKRDNCKCTDSGGDRGVISVHYSDSVLEPINTAFNIVTALENDFFPFFVQ